MRVTLVCPYDPRPRTHDEDKRRVGGVERVFGHVSAGLARQGHEVTVLSSTEGPTTDVDENGMRTIRVHRSGIFMGTPMVSLAKHIPSDTQLIHVAATYPFTTSPVLRRAKALGVPSVLDFHFEPHPASWLGQLAATTYRQFGPTAYGLAKATLVRSFSYGRSARSLATVPEARWRAVPNGIDPASFRPEGGACKGEYVLFVGRLVPYKGVEVLLHALSGQQGAPPLVLVGDGPSRPSLEELAKRLGVDATFLGRVADEALPPIYRGASVTVLPSINRQECFGISLLESMACGTPIVASDLPGVDEVALLGGLLSPPGDAVSLRAQLRRATEPGLLLRGQELASRVHRVYSWDAITAKVDDVYNEVRSSPRPLKPEVARIANPRRNSVL